MSEIIDAIKSCFNRGKILWTYHVNMRLKDRFIPRDVIIAAVDTFEIIESYPQDKYMPSYLLCAEHNDIMFHLLVALDTENGNVRIITAYRPSPGKWDAEGKKRR